MCEANSINLCERDDEAPVNKRYNRNITITVCVTINEMISPGNYSEKWSCWALHSSVQHDQPSLQWLRLIVSKAVRLVDLCKVAHVPLLLHHQATQLTCENMQVIKMKNGVKPREPRGDNRKMNQMTRAAKKRISNTTRKHNTATQHNICTLISLHTYWP